MADNEILVTTRYTAEGYDQAISKAESIGRSMRQLGSNLTQLGYLFDNDLVKSIGHGIQAFQDLASAASDAYNIIGSLPPSLAGGVIFGGAALAGSAVGKAYNTATGTVDTSTFVAAAQRLQDALKKIPADQAAAAMETFNIKMQGASSAQRVAAMNALSDSIDQIGLAAQKNLPLISDFYQKADQLLPRILQYQQEQSQKRFGDLTDNIRGKIQAAQAYQDKLSSASEKYHAAEFDRAKSLFELNREIDSQRIAAAQSLAADLARMDQDYYANRLKAAESFGLESARAEEDHQREMRRMSQEHEKRLSRLADERDALGLADEMANYEDQRKAAEEDYSVAQARRNQDYANQMRDMERAFQQQRQERINAYNQQLQDIAVYNAKQREMIAAQFRDIAAAVLKAFTDAAKQYTASNSTTNTTNQSMTQTNNFGSVSNPQEVAEMVHTEIAKVFRAVQR